VSTRSCELLYKQERDNLPALYVRTGSLRSVFIHLLGLCNGVARPVAILLAVMRLDGSGLFALD